MKRSLVVLVAALALPAAAAAKGPSKAQVSGPGLQKAIVITGAEAPGTPLMTFAESSGFFPLVYGQSPDPTLRQRPNGKLGPRYSVVWRVPGPNSTVSTIRSDLYPYATPYAVSYLKPGQRFWDGQRTYGGWFVADGRTKNALVRAGLPATPTAGGGGGGSSTPWWIAGVVGGLGLLAGAAWILVRRRPHGTTAPEPT
jgi:hypothetical protein